MEKGKTKAFLILVLTLLPLKILNISEATISPITADITERADAATVIIKEKTPSEAVYRAQGAFDVWITAYASVPEETKSYGSPFITASNKYVQDGFVAANFLPFGTKIMIPEFFGDKVFTVEDRMSKRKTNFIDIWMPTVEAAIKFGIHRTNIVVLGDPVAGRIAER